MECTNDTHTHTQPSLLALAVLGCDLKLIGCDWLTAIVTLQSLSKIQGRELSVCYESVLSEYSSVALQYPLLVTPRTITAAVASSTTKEGLKAAISPEPHFNLPVKAPGEFCSEDSMPVGASHLQAKSSLFAGSVAV